MESTCEKLKDLCFIKTGLSVARGKQAAEGDSVSPEELVDVLLPKAISGGTINRGDLAKEPVGQASEEYFTKEGDVVIKLSTPYDAAYVDEANTGIFVTSFAMVLRKASDKIDMRYLAMYLNSRAVAPVLAARSTGASVVKLLKKADIESLEIPLPPLDVQARLVALDQLIRKRRACYEQLIELDQELLNSQLLDAVRN